MATPTIHKQRTYSECRIQKHTQIKIQKYLGRIKSFAENATACLFRDDRIELNANVENMRLVINAMRSSLGLSDEILMDGTPAKEAWLRTSAGTLLAYVHSIDERLVRNPEVGPTGFWRYSEFDGSFFNRALDLVERFNDVRYVYRCISPHVNENTAFIILVGLGIREEVSPAACIRFFPDDHHICWPNTNFGDMQKHANCNPTTSYLWPINLADMGKSPGSEMEEEIQTSAWPSSQLVDILSFWNNFNSQLKVVLRLPTIGLTCTRAIPFIDANKSIKVIYFTKMRKILMSRLKWVKIFTAWYTRASLAPGGVRFNELCAKYREM